MFQFLYIHILKNYNKILWRIHLPYNKAKNELNCVKPMNHYTSINWWSMKTGCVLSVFPCMQLISFFIYFYFLLPHNSNEFLSFKRKTVLFINNSSQLSNKFFFYTTAITMFIVCLCWLFCLNKRKIKHYIIVAKHMQFVRREIK